MGKAASLICLVAASLSMRVVEAGFFSTSSKGQAVVGAGGEVAALDSSGVNSASGGKSDELLLLDREVSSVQEMIALQERKLALLQAMRGHVMAGKRLPSSMSAESPLDKLMATFDGGEGGARFGTTKRTSRGVQEGTSVASTSVNSVNVAGTVGNNFDGNMLMDRAYLSVNTTVVAAKMLAFKSRSSASVTSRGRKGNVGVMKGRGKPGSSANNYVNVLVLAEGGGGGALLFVDSDGETMLRLPRWGFDPPLSDVSKNSSPSPTPVQPRAAEDHVTHLSFDSGSQLSDQPLLAVGFGHSGRVVVLNMTLWKDGSILAGRRVRVKKDPDTGKPLPGQVPPEEPQIFTDGLGVGIVVKHETTIQLHPFLTNAAREAAAAKATAKAAKKKGSSVQVQAEEEQDGQPSVTSEGGEAASSVVPSHLTALAIYTGRSGGGRDGAAPSSKRMLAIADDVGGIYNVERNGTFLRNATILDKEAAQAASTAISRGGARPAPSSSSRSRGVVSDVGTSDSSPSKVPFIRDMRKSGTMIALAEDSGVSFLSTSRFNFGASFCKGGATAAVSVAFDVLALGMLYVGFESGEVVLYNTKARNDKNTVCRKLYKLPNLMPQQSKTSLETSSASQSLSSSHLARSYVQVTTVRGYVLVAVPGDGIHVYNSTEVRDAGVRWIGKTAFPAYQPSSATTTTPSKSRASKKGCASASSLLPKAPPIAVSAAAGSARIPEIMIAVPSTPRSTCSPAVEDDVQITLFEALLPYDPPVHDISWMRMPMMAGGLLIVFGYQFFKGGGKGSFFGGRRGGRGGRGRGSSGTSFDMDDLASEEDLARSFERSRYGRGSGGIGSRYR